MHAKIGGPPSVHVPGEGGRIRHLHVDPPSAVVVDVAASHYVVIVSIRVCPSVVGKCTVADLVQHAAPPDLHRALRLGEGGMLGQCPEWSNR